MFSALGIDLSQFTPLITAVMVGYVLFVVGVIYYFYFKPTSNRLPGELTPWEIFFSNAGGANKTILQKIAIDHPSEVDRYVRSGTFVFLIAIYAFMVGAFAFSTITNNYFIIFGCGLFWAVYIFCLDRFLLSSMHKNKWVVLGRIILTVFISLVMTVPLELWIFDKEIAAQYQEQLLSDKQNLTLKANHTQEINALKAEITSMETKIKEQQEKCDKAEKQMLDEAENLSRPGKGPLYAEKLKAFERQKEELAELKDKYNPLISSKLNQITKLEEDSQLAIDQNMQVKEQANGILARLETLHSLTQKHPTMLIASILLGLLLFFIDLSPMLIKLLSTNGHYDMHLIDVSRRSQLAMDIGLELDTLVLSAIKTNDQSHPLSQQINQLSQDVASSFLQQYKTSRIQPSIFSQSGSYSSTPIYIANHQPTNLPHTSPYSSAFNI